MRRWPRPGALRSTRLATSPVSAALAIVPVANVFVSGLESRRAMEEPVGFPGATALECASGTADQARPLVPEREVAKWVGAVTVFSVEDVGPGDVKIEATASALSD